MYGVILMILTCLFLLFVPIFLFGITELIHLICSRFLKPESIYTRMIVRLSVENAPQQLLYIGEELKWGGRDFTERVIAILPELDAQAECDCRRLANKYEIILIPEGEICSELNRLGLF